MNKASSILFVVVYGIALVVNVLAGAGKDIVQITNSDLAATHPVYILPSGYTFSVWGIIYTLLILFAVYQALPAQRDDAACVAARPYATGAMALNAAWLVVAGNQAYWAAFLIIAGYWYCLLRAVNAVDAVLDAAAKQGDEARGAPALWKTHLFVRAGLTANLAWVTVATLLQVSICLLEAGFFPYEDFSAGLLAAALGVAVWRVLRGEGDVTYALVSVWALFGIVHNQTSASSTFGCASHICVPKCVDGTFGICTRRDDTDVRGLPVGFKSLCADYTPGGDKPDTCVVPKSDAIVSWCYLGAGIVAVALVAGLVKKYLRHKGLCRGLLDLRRRGSSDRIGADGLDEEQAGGGGGPVTRLSLGMVGKESYTSF